MVNTTVTRRLNVLALFQGYAELALTAWRSTNSAGRKALKLHLESIVKAMP